MDRWNEWCLAFWDSKRLRQICVRLPVSVGWVVADVFGPVQSVEFKTDDWIFIKVNLSILINEKIESWLDLCIQLTVYVQKCHLTLCDHPLDELDLSTYLLLAYVTIFGLHEPAAAAV